jgi:Txe/YoeB family toxin of Txe-Axe toxin-antitoxin module
MTDEKRCRVLFARRAVKDVEHLSPKLRKKLKEIVENRLATDPHSGKKLVGDLAEYRSVRLTYRDRIVYRIDNQENTVYIVRARTHYQ